MRPDNIHKMKDDFVFNKKTYKEQLRYLKDLFDYQESRQVTIENKLSQLIGQTGIVFSLMSLFIPLFYKEFLLFGTGAKIVLLTPFIISLYKFLFSIHHSAKSLDISKDNYSTGSPTTVTKNHPTPEDFIEEEIKDLFTSITTNSNLNDKKADKLVIAQQYFRRGIYFFGILVVFLSIALFFMNS